MNETVTRAPGTASLIGQRIPKMDAPEKASGKTRYVHDIELPGQLHAAILRSARVHARIVRIDTTAARALPGVHAVLDRRRRARPAPDRRGQGPPAAQARPRAQRARRDRRGGCRQRSDRAGCACNSSRSSTRTCPSSPTPRRRSRPARRWCTRRSPALAAGAPVGHRRQGGQHRDALRLRPRRRGRRARPSRTWSSRTSSNCTT